MTMPFSYRLVLSALGLLLIASSAHSQGILDGLRLGSNPLSIGTRSMAMGDAMIAASNDYSTLAYNPAALTLMEHGELALSVFFKNNSSSAQFLGTTSTDDITNTVPFSFGYAAPIETTQGHLAVGISLDRVADFTSSYKFKAVNPSSSFLDTRGFVNDPGKRGRTINDYINDLYYNNLAYSLFLTYAVDSITPYLTTPFSGGLEQSGTVIQEGGINALRVGAGIDVAENIAVGATVNFMFGSYNYRRNYSETDVNNIFSRTDSTNPNGFMSAQIVDTRSQSIGAINLKLGLYAEPNEYVHFGLTFETPTFYSIDDQFNRYGVSSFNYGVVYDSRTFDPPLEGSIVNSYSVTTPLKIGAGLAFSHWGLTVAASADYCDYTQLRFDDGSVDLSDLNDYARESLRGVLRWNIGGEYLIKPIGLLVRGGYSVNPSPFKGDPSSYDTKTISGGLGLLLSKATMIELSYQRSTYSTLHTLYNDFTVAGTPVSASVNNDDIVSSAFALSFSFRF